MTNVTPIAVFSELSLTRLAKQPNMKPRAAREQATEKWISV